ncbi:hypothetical protein IB265_33095 [Ensifer sp. ENS10]|uniref:hypothetical protein n=1 Tax=Ensifer sp. ENS10 TaxID=2769286 RepID=UPI001785D6CA|nr:hypothetical protein [Ensifer sp. ENS10]MBD9511595.1 hypothetical protein [Ensifer sp. ENS10]
MNTYQLHELYDQIPAEPTASPTHKTQRIIEKLWGLKERGVKVHLVVDRNKRPYLGRQDRSGISPGILAHCDRVEVIETDGTHRIIQDRTKALS